MTPQESNPIRFSIIVPSYRRGEELLKTIPQIHAAMSAADELVVVDQTEHHPAEIERELSHLSRHPRTRIHRPQFASAPMARNLGAWVARGVYLLFLDDDVDIEPNLLDEHQAIYENSTVHGVAGSYYAGSFDRPWVAAAQSNGSARTLAGAHMSFRKDSYWDVGGSDTNLVASFAGDDWELAERFLIQQKRIAVGEQCFVFHRAPAEGGCGNQGFRSNKWYENALHNHVYWILKRPWPHKLTRLPRHIIVLAKYIRPRPWHRVPRFLIANVLPAVLRAFLTHKNRSNPPYTPKGYTIAASEQTGVAHEVLR